MSLSPLLPLASYYLYCSSQYYYSYNYYYLWDEYYRAQPSLGAGNTIPVVFLNIRVDVRAMELFRVHFLCTDVLPRFPSLFLLFLDSPIPLPQISISSMMRMMMMMMMMIAIVHQSFLSLSECDRYQCPNNDRHHIHLTQISVEHHQMRIYTLEAGGNFLHSSLLLVPSQPPSYDIWTSEENKQKRRKERHIT